MSKILYEDELTKYILEEDNLVHKYTKKKPSPLMSDQDWYDIAEMSEQTYYQFLAVSEKINNDISKAVCDFLVEHCKQAKQ